MRGQILIILLTMLLSVSTMAEETELTMVKIDIQTRNAIANILSTMSKEYWSTGREQTRYNQLMVMEQELRKAQIVEVCLNPDEEGEDDEPTED